ncbi:peptidoglycan-binding protein [Spirulina subsalsa FACHB-351]|uniref:Peptidoglycan-binding protein n=1 Tax=Spirulina subsalsa FACHB-351 TaxID=234711 RepID=A0ABT3L1D4_9CYAN|nr:peptidoglycan-binding domain-containing protein [Spirulina subsalsa]MCW6035306.1 peptidoglycan-binding protein [Spirulina subsalsa FACHB-351]
MDAFAYSYASQMGSGSDESGSMSLEWLDFSPLDFSRSDWAFQGFTLRIWLYTVLMTLVLSVLLPPHISGATVRQVRTPHGGCLNIRRGPGMEFGTVTCLGNGQRVEVIAAQGTWLQLENGNWLFGPYTIGQEVTTGGASGNGNSGEEVGLGEQGFLTVGARGPLVETVQSRLVALGYNLGPTGADGVFGVQTEQAVLAFQRAQGLEYVDGKVGRETLTALGIGTGGTVVNNPSPSPHSNSGGETEARVFRDCEMANGEIIAPGSGAVVRAGPNYESQPVGASLPDGTKVRVEELVAGWYRLDGTSLNLWVPAVQVRRR